ncbi:hypothetical protein [Ferrimonas lipolytica]|uniref:Nickel/cobalt transporter regulator n=1 Tax=Ferrimonas lipolytica TaxID=2724191 RepID=A0A6H1UAG0_9GAMM|nr:hypothetical protein [Ferrimonas lipolytica]QIZ75818.1 hypothetical protein HER31_02230 [Ferrimonas lipolytica]
MKPILISLVIATLAATPALAKNGHGHDNNHKKTHNKVIVVKPGKHYKTPKHRSYYRRDIRDIATFAVFAGISYAVIDNVFYRQQGDQYVYVSQPPVGSYTVTTTQTTTTPTAAVSATAAPAASYGGYTIGSIVSALPAGHKAVSVDGVSYRQYQGVWFAPIAGSSQFVVVNSPL